MIAAAQTGHAVELDLFPDGENGPVARARLVAGAAEPDPLFAAVSDRRSCKEPFEVSTGRSRTCEPCWSLSRTIVTAPDQVAQLIDLTWSAWKVEAETPRTFKESVDLMRIGKAEINAQPDGIDLGGPFLSSLALVGMLSREGQLDPTILAVSRKVSRSTKRCSTRHRPMPCSRAPATPAPTRSRPGRRWLRLNLATTAHGLALHPVSQALQEYPEMREHYDRAHQLLAPEGHTVQMLGRLGYGPSTPPTPRWPLEAKIIDA